MASLLGLILFAGCQDEAEGPTADLRCLGNEPIEGYSVIIRECAVGSCSDGVFCNGFETCQGREVEGGDSFVCECEAGPPPCTGEQQCDERRQECLDCATPDRDGDDFDSIECGGVDCNDDDVAISPAATEVCDELGVDEDCDPSTVSGEDRDGDGYFSDACSNPDPGGGIIRGRDCNDLDPAVRPGQNEVCNGVDDNCDGDVDERLLAPLFDDADNDGFGAGESMFACAPAAGKSLVGGDCDDTNPAIHPGALRCVEGGQGVEYMICRSDGTWETDVCPNFGRCVAQPNETGICLD